IHASESTTVSLNYVSQQGGDAGNVLSASASAAPFAGLHAGVEVGGGRAPSGAASRGLAWPLRGRRPLIRFEWTGEAVDPGYPVRHGRGDQHNIFASAGRDGGWQWRATETVRAIDLSAYRVAYSLNDRERSLGLQLAPVTLEWRGQELQA